MKRVYHFSIVLIVTVIGLLGPGLEAKNQNADHLVPLSPFFVDRGSVGTDYWKLVQKKLFVTPGGVARFVHLPGLGGKDCAISIYRDNRKKNSLTGGYWLTVTQASDWLWLSILRGSAKITDPKTVTIDRCDVPLPESTAIAIHEAWLAMLSGIRAAPENEISVDSSTEIYSTTNSAGIRLQGTSGKSEGKKTSAIFRLAMIVLEYCYKSPPERVNHAQKIEKAARALRQR
jgi:hypothetical protein